MNHYFTKNSTIRSEEKLIEFEFKNEQYKFYTDNGVFSKDEFDTGTKVLLESIDFNSLKGEILDFGCGYGPIGIIISKNTNTFVDMIDVNDRAVALTRKNIELNNLSNINAFESDCYENVTKQYDYIITNPPIRVGKEILYKILRGAKQHLKENGELWFVINKNQGAKTTARDISDIYNVEVINKNKNFFVIRAKSN